MLKIKPKQTLGEELANSITHGVGVGLSVAALSLLVIFAGQKGDPWRVVSFSIYGATLFLLYLISMLYHSFTNLRLKAVFNIMDHMAIFLLIAGTYTPFTLVTLRGPLGWALFGLIWGLAITGIIFKAVFINRFKFISVLLYLGMGWLALIAIGPLWRALSPEGFIWLSIGGLCYTLGIIFYAWSRVPYGHMIWHLFVLGGSISHFFCMLWYVLP